MLKTVFIDISKNKKTHLAVSSKLAVISTARIITNAVAGIGASVNTSLNAALWVGGFGVVDYGIDAATVSAIRTLYACRDAVIVIFHVVVIISLRIRLAPLAATVASTIASKIVVKVVTVVGIVVIVLRFGSIVANTIERELTAVVTDDTLSVFNDVSNGNGLLEGDFASTSVNTCNLNEWCNTYRRKGREFLFT
jgi:hypothetical protein